MRNLLTTIVLILAVATSAWAQCTTTCTLSPPGQRFPLLDWRFVNGGNLPQTQGVYMTEDNISIRVESGASLNLNPNEIEMVLTSSVDWKKEVVAFNACTGRGQSIFTQGSNKGPVHMRLSRSGCVGDTVILRKEKLFQGMVDMYHFDPNRLFRLWGGKKITINWSQDGWVWNSFPPTCNFPCVPTSTDVNQGILYDTDGRADVAVWRQNFSFGTANWFARNSSTGAPVQRLFGHPGDIPVPFDYDGDGRTDMALFRPSTGEWLIINSLTGQLRTVPWGTFGDQPAAGDFDGDGKADLAVWRPSSSLWFIKGYITGAESTRVGDAVSDQQAVGDYNGDHKTDLALWNPFDSNWKIFITDPPQKFLWGPVSGIPVPADYDGDGATDFIVYKDGTWSIKLSNSGTQNTVAWGVPGDIPIPRDYDGDGRADLTIFRPSTGEWWMLNKNGYTYQVQVHGTFGDIPVPSK